MDTLTAERPAIDWKSAECGAAARALDCFAAGDLDAGRYSLLARARYRDEMLNHAEVVAALGRNT